MNWDAIGAIGEILGALGVIITLIYLASQIRHNTKVARASTRQAISDSTAGMLTDLTKDADMGDIVVRAFNSEPLTKLESFRLHARCFRDFKHWENFYYQKREGLLPDEEWIGYRENLKLILSAPPHRNYWTLESSLYSKSFQSEVAEVLKDLDRNPMGDTIVTRMQSDQEE